MSNLLSMKNASNFDKTIPPLRIVKVKLLNTNTLERDAIRVAVI